MKQLQRYVSSVLFHFILLGSLLGTESPLKEAGFSFREGITQTKISIEIQNNLILFPVRINGSFELNFILDTGVRTTILTEPVLANFLEIDSTETISVRGLGEGEAIEANLARNVSIDLPGVMGRGINMVILPQGLVSYSELFGKPVYGIIGFELFRSFVVEINYAKKYVKLSSPFDFKPKKKWEKLEVEINRGKPYIEAEIALPDGQIETQSWLMDTGSSQALSMYSDKLGDPEPSIYTLLGQGLNGSIFGKLARVPQFSLGKFTFQSIVSAFPEPEALGIIRGRNAEWYGNLGSDILSRFTLIFNYQAGEVYFKKGAKFKRSFDYNLSGVEVLAGGLTFDEFRVSYVRPDSPAAQSGLQSGDEILRINGVSVDDVEIGELYGMINKKAGRRISLIVRREEETQRINFVLEQEI